MGQLSPACSPVMNSFKRLREKCRNEDSSGEELIFIKWIPFRKVSNYFGWNIKLVSIIYSQLKLIRIFRI